MIYNVKINQICITLVYSQDTIYKKMRNLNVKLIIETRFYMNLLKYGRSYHSEPNICFWILVKSVYKTSKIFSLDFFKVF